MSKHNDIPSSTIQIVMGAFDKLLDDSANRGVFVLYDLWKAAREPGYLMSRRSAEVLKSRELILDWETQPGSRMVTARVHDAVATIALAGIRVDRSTGTITLRSLDDVRRKLGA